MKQPRDMTRKQFSDALRRRGWRQVLAWIEVGGGRSIGMVLVGGKFNRRASLAHAIREVEKPTNDVGALYAQFQKLPAE